MRGTAKNSVGATSRTLSGTVSMLSAKLATAPDRSGSNTVKVRSAMWQSGRNASCSPPSERDESIGVVELKQHVAVRQHRALGRPCRAGGVDEQRQFVGLGGVDEVLPQARMGVVVAAERKQLVESHHLRVAEVCQPFQIEDDHLADLRTALAHLEILVELLLILDEQEA